MIARGGHFTQDGHAVQKFAITRSVTMMNELQNQEFPPESLFFIGHQANLNMLNSVCKRTGIEQERHLFNVDAYGNGGAAGAPGVFSQNWDRFNKGDRLAMVIVGAGLAWCGMLLERTA